MQMLDLRGAAKEIFECTLQNQHRRESQVKVVVSNSTHLPVVSEQNRSKYLVGCQLAPGSLLSVGDMELGTTKQGKMFSYNLYTALEAHFDSLSLAGEHRGDCPAKGNERIANEFNSLATLLVWIPATVCKA